MTVIVIHYSIYHSNFTLSICVKLVVTSMITSLKCRSMTALFLPTQQSTSSDSVFLPTHLSTWGSNLLDKYFSKKCFHNMSYSFLIANLNWHNCLYLERWAWIGLSWVKKTAPNSFSWSSLITHYLSRQAWTSPCSANYNCGQLNDKAAWNSSWMDYEYNISVPISIICIQKKIVLYV